MYLHFHTPTCLHGLQTDNSNRLYLALLPSRYLPLRFPTRRLHPLQSFALPRSRQTPSSPKVQLSLFVYLDPFNLWSASHTPAALPPAKASDTDRIGGEWAPEMVGTFWTGNKHHSCAGNCITIRPLSIKASSDFPYFTASSRAELHVR